MDRRTALKNLSLSLGYAVATPTIFNMLSSCTAETNTWKPLFLSEQEKNIVIHLADIILPASNTPGALDVNVPQFLDVMYYDIEKVKNQELFKEGATIFAQKFSNKYNLEVIDGERGQFEKLLAEYFNLSDDDSKAILKQQKLPIAKIDDTQLENYTLYKFLLSIKNYTLFGYYTSEKVGEEVLNYDPIPGVQMGCIPIEDVPNGRAWSL
jgi:hypothetical protein